MKYSLALFLAVGAVVAQAQTLTTLATFGAGTPGPNSLIQGADGNFYGTTGGQTEPGGIFQVTPSGAITTLYSFPSSYASSLLQVKDGSFYGTTPNGGTNANCNSAEFSNGCGSIFQFTLPASLKTLYSFDFTHGVAPFGPLIQAKDGTFYGTTFGGGALSEGGTRGFGSIFNITAAGALTTLHNFAGMDGATPNGLIQGTDGNLYGTTQNGGDTTCFNLVAEGCGIAFKITTTGSFTPLHDFNGQSEGLDPDAALIQGRDGNFYGTTAAMPFQIGTGALFQLTPGGSLTTVYTFQSFGTNGAFPQYPLIQAADGNFYGITPEGGANSGPNNPCGHGNAEGCGTIFQVTPSGTYTNLYTFCSQPECADGTGPNALVLGTDGNFYGTTGSGGANNAGTFFKLSLASPDAPAIAPSGGVVNGASFLPGIGAGSWITISGINLAAKPDSWTVVDGVLPTMIDGVSVLVGGQPAYVEYVSPTQINALAPDIPAGTVPVTVTTATGTSQPVNAQLSAESPAFFLWGTYAVATHQDFSLAVKNGTFPGTTTVPAAPGDVIILWATGLGPTSPAAPAGMVTPSTATYNTANTVSVKVGTATATVYGAALAPAYAGLYQIAIQIPASLANGDYPVVATVNGTSSPSTTLITVQH